MGTRSRRLSPQASTRRPTTLRAIVPTTRMMATAVRNPSPGRGRPSIFSYMGAKTSSIRLQKIQRSHAVRKTGTATKKPAIKRTLSQFLMVSSRIAPRASGAGRVRRRALVTGGAIRVGQAIALSLARALGGLDVLVNNAAIFARTPFATTTPVRYDRLLGLNLRAAFFSSQEAAAMMRRRGGHIVNIGDAGATGPRPHYSPSTLAKVGSE